MSSSGIFPNDDWAIAEGDTPQGPIIMRYRTGDPSFADRDLFDKLILVRWSYEPGEIPGLPSSELLTAMEEFEEPVLNASDKSRWWGSCVAVITHDCTREWRFYTPDVAAFQKEFSEALRGLGPYPLELQVFDDPEWNGFEEIRQSTR